MQTVNSLVGGENSGSPRKRMYRTHSKKSSNLSLVAKRISLGLQPTVFLLRSATYIYMYNPTLSFSYPPKHDPFFSIKKTMESNSSNTLFFFCFVYLLCLGHCSSQNANATAGKSLVEKVCANSPHRDMCVASLKTDPNSASANVEGLAEIALKVAHANATDTLRHITHLLANSSTMDPFLNDCLVDCSENYIDAMDQIDDTLVSLTDKAFDDANTWLQAALADVETCEKGFHERPGYESLLAKRNSIFNQLCNNAMAVIEELKSGA